MTMKYPYTVLVVRFIWRVCCYGLIAEIGKLLSREKSLDSVL